jgi:hypothetical protein
MISKASVKRLLGEVPLTAEIYWQLRQNGKPLSKSFSLRRTQKRLPLWLSEAGAARQQAPRGRKLLIFATLRYWIEHATLLSVAMAGLGHTVALAYLPYAGWRTPVNRFDLRRHNAYAQSVLRPADALVKPISLLDVGTVPRLPPVLAQAVEEIALRDAQYTLQVEDVDRSGALFRLRVERNAAAARAALSLLQRDRPDVVLTPNGSIFEMGAFYQAARFLDIPVVTYEFGEQRQRIWLARNGEVMRQETDALWAQRGEQPLTDEQLEQVRHLFASRQRASLWENFSRRWQGQPSQGGAQARQALGLDARPVVLLAANVIGDSLTLGRQVFTESMTGWLQRTVQGFAARPDVQLVVRVHPGERYTQGPSVAEVIWPDKSLPLPENIHIVAAGDPVNTYDLVEIADLGLVYTTTVGMEMAMSGVPAIVIGQTHYRGKGFTLDPDSWEAFDALLDKALADPAAYRLTGEQVQRAWNYAYRFYFEYPCPFPWHLLHFWNELEAWPVKRVLSAEGQALFGDSFRYLAGERRDFGTNRMAEQAAASASVNEGSLA